MNKLPDEIWIQVLDYLCPEDLLPVQRVSSRLHKIARDSALWRSKCFERAPSAVHAFSGNADSLSDLLNGLSLVQPEGSRPGISGSKSKNRSRRAKAITKWDCTDASEQVDWYSEYIARHAPLSTEWLHHVQGNEIRSMALFSDDKKILSAMEDGSLRIWNVSTSSSGRRSLSESARNPADLLCTDLAAASSSSTPRSGSATIGLAVDSTMVDSHRNRAYVAVEDILNEIDLSTMRLVSQNRYAWNITAISQQSSESLPLMVGTSFSLHMHDPRIPLRCTLNHDEPRIDIVKEESNTVFLPNYRKEWAKQRSFRNSSPPPTMQQATLAAWAPVEPGPQTILHNGQHEIIVAGRMPSILFYDQRQFPRLQSVIHSGTRLSSLITLPYAPADSTLSPGSTTLVAAGEYRGRGSLEIYELPSHRLTADRQPSYNSPESHNSYTSTTASSSSTPPEPLEQASSYSPEREPYCHKNRQSSSSAKLLSLTTQGARLLYSDSEGTLKWVERDGRGLARRWNINSYSYNPQSTTGAVVGDAAARKLLTLSRDTTSETGSTKGDGDVLFWTGSDLGIVTSKAKWTGHDELVKAFEEKMNLEESGEGLLRRRSREQEEEYARTMRRALERQADERRFLARFGTTRGG